MRKYLWLAIVGAFISSSVVYAQDSSNVVKKKKDWSKVKLSSSGRAADHIMIGFGHDGWSGESDTLDIKELSRHFNAAFMYDFPFKTAPRLSFAGGVGINNSSIFFNNTNIDITGKSGKNRIEFTDATNTDRFKKYKLSTTYLEVPLELRFTQDPLKSGKSFKFALGLKVGTLIDAHIKGKDFVNASGTTYYGPKYKEKEKNTRFFNTTKFAATVRIGYGIASLFGSYQLNTLFKDNQGPVIRPYSIGVCISGL